MQQLSDLYQAIVAQPYTVEVMLRVDGRDYGSDALVSVTTDCGVFKDECPAVGNAVSGCITAEMLTSEESIPMTSKMEFFCRAVSLQDGAQSEWIPKGVFWLDTRKQELTDSGLQPTISLSGYDALLKAEEEYTPTGQWPKTDQEVLDDICNRLGINCDEQLENHYSVSYPTDYTCRELLGFIAAAYGGNWIIDEQGDLVLLRLNRETERFPLKAQRVTAGGSLTPITQVTVHRMNGTTYTAGAAGRTLNVDCPWATQTMADTILQQVEGYRYCPFSAEAAILPPSVQLGDDCGLGPVFSIQAEYLGGIIADISAPPEEEIAHNYPSPAGGGAGGRALAATRKLTEATKSLVAQVEDVAAGMTAYVKNSDLEDYKVAINRQFATISDDVSSLSADLVLVAEKADELETASATLSTRVGDAEASIRLTAEKVEDHEWAIAEIDADVIDLKGRVDVTGVLSVDNGIITSSGQIISQKNIRANTGLSSTKLELDTEDFTMAGKSYVPTEITSTTGTVRVLGIA